MHRRTLSMTFLLTAAALVLPGLAHADERSGVLTQWTLTEGDEAIGLETARIVDSDTAYFASGQRKITKGRQKVHLVTHLQRDDAGALARYRRVVAGLRGQGVFAFPREGQIRVVGVNTSAKPSDHRGIERHHVWDPQTWHHLTHLVRRLGRETRAADVQYFDPEARRTGTLSLERVGMRAVTDDKKAVHEVGEWVIRGGPGGASLTAFVDSRGRLVGVRGGDRAMLLKGWSWDGRVVVDTPDDDDDGAARRRAADDDGDDDDDDAGDTDVGP